MPARKSTVAQEVEQFIAEGDSSTAQVSNSTPVSMPERANRQNRSDGFAPEKLKSIMTYRWLDILDEAYKHGFISFVESNVTPYETLDRTGKPQTTWVARAVAQFSDGSYHSAIGEANYENCNATIGNSAARMAETRAKSRALAHAMNLDANVDFEMADPNNPEASAIKTAPAYANRSAKTAAPASNGFTPQGVPVEKWPDKNVPDGWACVNCGEAIGDSAKYKAGERAYFSQRQNGKILCFNCQKEAQQAA